MVPVTLSFPLFKLPYLAWRNVIQTMGGHDLIHASLCTKNMKRVVRSFFRNPNDCCIDIDDGQLNILLDEPVTLRVGFLLSDLSTLDPCRLRFYEYPSTTLLTFQNFRLKNWFDYIIEIFHVKKISSLSFKYIPNFELIDLRILRNLTEGLGIFQLDTSTCVGRHHIARILDNFPNIRNLLLATREPSLIRQIVNRKFDSVHFTYGLSVDEILPIKAKFISVTMHDYNINQVLKKWLEGWNPLLTRMKFRLVEWKKPSFIFDIVLNRINHDKITKKRKTQVTIENREGISATITFKRTHVDMLVADH